MSQEPFLMETDLFCFPPAKEPKLLGPIVLAYIGDAIYEVFIRQYVISMANQRPNHLHKLSTQYVSARSQAKSLQRLMPILTEEEADIVKRGRNAKSGTSAKNADILEYRHSTAFECLLGYLYYTKQLERLQYIMMQTLEPNQHDAK
ncbi:ribonuclease-3 family protein [Paenibacillus sp. 1_12]|uniref:Mini-ribonuclease 3 n=1 Tax=Paenibacillus sp. 1_12 TaxID=1566278 RepID=UPI0008F3A631|nr:Mini-ribonuclease 3 [Paenibacillus sp. 1_12]SFM33391.1 ribonuclease-3 family protein [Paenibacillus sp. 1_12]